MIIPFAEDERPYINEAVNLAETMKRSHLDALFRTARYLRAYATWVSVKKAFPALLELGLVDSETKEATAKGRCLYRYLVSLEMDES